MTKTSLAAWFAALVLLQAAAVAQEPPDPESFTLGSIAELRAEFCDDSGGSDDDGGDGDGNEVEVWEDLDGENPTLVWSGTTEAACSASAGAAVDCVHTQGFPNPKCPVGKACPGGAGTCLKGKWIKAQRGMWQHVCPCQAGSDWLSRQMLFGVAFLALAAAAASLYMGRAVGT